MSDADLNDVLAKILTVNVMKSNLITAVAVTMALCAISAVVWQARAANDLVQFPESYDGGVHYATVNRGNIREELFTSRDAIDAVKNGQPIPSGTAITLVDYRDGELFRYVVMEKRTGWGAQYPSDIRNDEWEFQWFNPDRSVKQDEDLMRCMGCHKSQERQDFVWTLDRMRSSQ
jgi:hypothetical protein